MSHVGRFTSVDAVVFPRGSRVVCRTSRGLEVGEVLGPADPASASDGSLLRGVTVEDDLLISRQERNRSEACAACQTLLEERQIDAVLMDVEHLFDGESLYFYFLGEVTPEVDQLTSELADAYDTQVRFRQFADVVTAGCGPDCGTEAGAGCGTSCGSCAISGACGVKHR